MAERRKVRHLSTPSLSSHDRKTQSSPYINRFLQPDTIIPNLSNPQSWNRYSYVSNSPTNYSDPSGHGQCKTQEDCKDMGVASPNDGGKDPIKKLDADGAGGGAGDVEDLVYDYISGIDNPYARYRAYALSWYYFRAWQLDAWLYHNVPSAYGIEIPGVTFSVNQATFEGSAVLLFNWRSFELDTYITGGGGGTLSFPPGLSASANIIPFSVKGASSNSSWEGSYVAGSLQAYLPFEIPGGGIAGGSYSTTGWDGFVEAVKTKDISPFLFRDPKSGLHVTTEFGGAGIGSPGVSGSLTFGSTLMHVNIFDLNSPSTLVLPNNPYLPGP
jgi:hypothetical protein